MADVDTNSKRIAKNTLFLYIRMLITLLIGLYTSRVVLQTLGVSDFGLYNVVGGMVILFTFLNNTLASGTQRFLSFSLGEDDAKKMSEVFSTTFHLHILLSVGFLIIAEIGGLFFLNYMLKIPEGRSEAALWVYHFSIIASMISILQVPFQSAIISHEKMDIFAGVSIYNAVMKLLIVYLIQMMNQDKLILYASFIMLVQLSTAFIFIRYCYCHFGESRNLRVFNRDIFREIASFSGWNVFGNAAVAFQGQGVNMLLNMFFGTIVNAARGIAFQVNGVIMHFVSNFQTAVNPQIVKLYASGQTEKMIHLVINNSKMAAYLFLIIAIPICIELEFLLGIWLGDYPDYTPIFLRIIILQSLVQTITRPVVMAIHAVGKMKAVNLTSGTALLLILPISYILLRLGASPETVFLVNVIPWFIELFFELYWLNRYIGFPFWGFYRKVYAVVFPLTIMMYVIPYSIKQLSGLDGWQSLILTCLVSTISSSLIVCYLGISKNLRNRIFNSLYARFKRAY